MHGAPLSPRPPREIEEVESSKSNSSRNKEEVAAALALWKNRSELPSRLGPF